MDKFLVIDTETTGLDPLKHGVIQLACVVEIDGDVVDEFQSHVKPFPGDLLNAEAMEITGTTREDMETYPFPNQALLDLRRFLMQYVDPFAPLDKFRPMGYNVDFDLKFWEQFFLKNGDNYFYSFVTHRYIDVLRVIQYMDSFGLLAFPDCKLETVCRVLGIDVAYDDMHNALTDVKATRALALWIADFIKGKNNRYFKEGIQN